jgi:hypothetical protein
MPITPSKPRSKLRISATPRRCITARWRASRALAARHGQPRAARVIIGQEDLIDHPSEGVPGRLDRLPPVDRDIPVEDLLEGLDVGHQDLPRRDRHLESVARSIAIWMAAPDEVHRDVRVDQDRHQASWEST